jgi:hypothetical protein
VRRRARPGRVLPTARGPDHAPVPTCHGRQVVQMNARRRDGHRRPKPASLTRGSLAGPARPLGRFTMRCTPARLHASRPPGPSARKPCRRGEGSQSLPLAAAVIAAPKTAALSRAPGSQPSVPALECTVASSFGLPATEQAAPDFGQIVDGCTDEGNGRVSDESCSPRSGDERQHHPLPGRPCADRRSLPDNPRQSPAVRRRARPPLRRRRWQRPAEPDRHRSYVRILSRCEGTHASTSSAPPCSARSRANSSTFSPGVCTLSPGLPRFW